MIKDYACRCEKSMLVSSVFILILGIILFIEPTTSLKMITFLIAILFMCIGLFQIVIYIKSPRVEKMTSLSLILGIILFAVGLYLLLNVETLINFITILIGITIAIKALFKIQFAINIRDISTKWKYNLLFGLLEMTLGIILLLNPFKSAVVFFKVMGAIMAIGSIMEIIETSMVIKNINDYKEIDE